MPTFQVRAKVTKEWSGAVEAASHKEAEQAAVEMADRSGSLVDVVYCESIEQ